MPPLFVRSKLLEAGNITRYGIDFSITQTKCRGAHDFGVTIIGAPGRIFVAFAISAQLSSYVLRMLPCKGREAGWGIALASGRMTGGARRYTTLGYTTAINLLT